MFGCIEGEGREREKKTLLHMFLDVKGKRNERKKIYSCRACFMHSKSFFNNTFSLPIKKKKNE
jgi:hypothetical protein